jgi:hypothetical protein
MVEGENYDKNMEHWHSPYVTSSPDVISDNYRPDFYPDRRDDVTHYKGKACTGIIIEKSRSEYFGVKLNEKIEVGKSTNSLFMWLFIREMMIFWIIF